MYIARYRNSFIRFLEFFNLFLKLQSADRSKLNNKCTRSCSIAHLLLSSAAFFFTFPPAFYFLAAIDYFKIVPLPTSSCTLLHTHTQCILPLSSFLFCHACVRFSFDPSVGCVLLGSFHEKLTVSIEHISAALLCLGFFYCFHTHTHTHSQLSLSSAPSLRSGGLCHGNFLSLHDHTTKTHSKLARTRKEKTLGQFPATNMCVCMFFLILFLIFLLCFLCVVARGSRGFGLFFCRLLLLTRCSISEAHTLERERHSVHFFFFFGAWVGCFFASPPGTAQSFSFYLLRTCACVYGWSRSRGGAQTAVPGIEFHISFPEQNNKKSSVS